MSPHFFIPRRLPLLLASVLLVLLLASSRCHADSSCSSYTDCDSCTGNDCAWCNGARGDRSAGTSDCQATGTTTSADVPPEQCLSVKDWYWGKDSNANCPAQRSDAGSSTGAAAATDLCSAMNGNCGGCLAMTYSVVVNSTSYYNVSVMSNATMDSNGTITDGTSSTLTLSNTTLTSMNVSAGCGFCSSTQMCTSSASSCGSTDIWSNSTCPIDTSDPCLRQSGCSACLSTPSCGYCAVGDRCLNGTASGPVLEKCLAQWSFKLPASSCPVPCSSLYLCADCLAVSGGRCSFCGTSGSCVANPNYGLGNTSTNAYPGCPTLYSITCPSSVIISAGPLTTTGSSASSFATAMVVILSLLSFPALAALLFLRRCKAVFARETLRARQITDFSEPTMSRPTNAFAPNVWEGRITISLDSSQNPNLKVVLGAGLIILFLFNLIALGLNTWSIYSPVSALTISALSGIATPSSSLTAGLLGLSGLHTLPPRGRGETYDCSLMAGGDDLRTCGTLGAAGGLTLFFSLASMLLITALAVWTALVGWSTWKRSSDVTLGAKKPQAIFHPHFFTLSALHSVCLLSAVLMWSFGGEISLATSIFVPYAQWSLGASWWMHLVAFFVSMPMVWFCQCRARKQHKRMRC
jgi:hypothetical protein